MLVAAMACTLFVQFWKFLLGACRSCWEVCTLWPDMMANHWIQQGLLGLVSHLGSLVGCSRQGVTGHGTSKYLAFPAWNSKHSCWRCKATSCDTMPNWDFSEGATWRTSRYKPGALFQGTKACRINCQSTIQLSRVHFGQGLHWCCALCGLGGHSRSSWQHLQ